MSTPDKGRVLKSWATEVLTINGLEFLVINKGDTITAKRNDDGTLTVEVSHEDEKPEPKRCCATCRFLGKQDGVDTCWWVPPGASVAPFWFDEIFYEVQPTDGANCDTWDSLEKYKGVE